jgi:hypothetical protein
MREINTERGLCPAWISSVPLADPRGHRTIALEYKAIRLKIGETLKNIKEKLPGGERKTRKTPWHCLARWLERSGFLAHACSRYHAPPGSLHTPTKTVCSICPASYVTVYISFSGSQPFSEQTTPASIAGLSPPVQRSTRRS